MQTHPSEMEEARRKELRKIGVENLPPMTGKQLLALLATLASVSFLFWFFLG